MMEGWERPIQHLYSLELSYNKPQLAAPMQMNPEEVPFRLRQDAAVAAHMHVQDIAQQEE